MCTVLDNLTNREIKNVKHRALMFKDCFDGSYDADDLAQDAFLKVLENQAKFRGECTPGSYVVACLPNLAMNRQTVEFGRGSRKGRKALNAEYGRERLRLNSLHGKRTPNYSALILEAHGG